MERCTSYFYSQSTFQDDVVAVIALSCKREMPQSVLHRNQGTVLCYLDVPKGRTTKIRPHKGIYWQKQQCQHTPCHLPCSFLFVNGRFYPRIKASMSQEALGEPWLAGMLWGLLGPSRHSLVVQYLDLKSSPKPMNERLGHQSVVLLGGGEPLRGRA
jgi:hypothetical protein